MVICTSSWLTHKETITKLEKMFITHALHMQTSNYRCRKQLQNQKKKMILFTHALHILNSICRQPQTTYVEKMAEGLQLSNIKAK